LSPSSLARGQPAGRAREGGDGGLGRGGQLWLGFALDQRRQLAGERVRARHPGGDAGASARGDGRPRLEGPKRSRLLEPVFGERTDRRLGVLA
jgi:hypothetical protein